MIAAIKLKAATLVLAAGTGTDAKPNDTLPGGSVLKDFVGGIMTYGMYFSVGGLVMGGAMWMFGSRSNNHQHASGGKTMVFAALCLAFLVGAANQLGASFQDMGAKVH